ncbi:MAG: serine acetyltransferase [Pseudomonadota bacterium]
MSDAISASEPDWDREKLQSFWQPSKRLLRSIRRYQAAGGRGLVGRLAKRYWVLQHRFWSVVTGAEVPINTRIGGGFMMPHPNGIVIHPGSEIGPNCLFFQQVTLAGGPTIGGHVDIGAGAKILGKVRIGDHARIGANAVVTRDIPSGATAVGVPARVLEASNGDQLPQA